MGKLIVTTWLSMDGFISGPRNDMSFVGKYFNDEMSRYEDTVVSTADTLLLGRKTYQSFAGSWPTVPDKPDVSDQEKAYAQALNGMRKVVFSKSLDTVEWNRSELRTDIDAADVQAIKDSTDKDLLIYGSASIVQVLTKLKLIDEYQLLVHPLFLGAGLPLFTESVALKPLRSTPMSSGVELRVFQLAD